MARLYEKVSIRITCISVLAFACEIIPTDNVCESAVLADELLSVASKKPLVVPDSSNSCNVDDKFSNLIKHLKTLSTKGNLNPWMKMDLVAKESKKSKVSFMN